MILGAPKFQQDHPEGLSEPLLIQMAAPLLRGLTVPEASWAKTQQRFPDTAITGLKGWRLHPAWGDAGAALSLRAGVALLALTQVPLDGRYRFLGGVLLFNEALYHESHDALEELWRRAEEPLRSHLQGLILLAGGYHHLQRGHAPGMAALWERAIELLAPSGGILETPWGKVRLTHALEDTAQRLDRLHEPNQDGQALWAIPQPRLEVIHDA